MFKNKKYKKQYFKFLDELLKIIEDDKKTDNTKFIAIKNMIFVENIKRIFND